MASDKNFDATAPRSPGPLLREKRLENGWSVADVARVLCLSSRQLEALENDDYQNLPGETYVLGYWRNYASFLGITLGDSVTAHKKYLRDTTSGRMPAPGVRGLRSGADSSNYHFGVLFALLSVTFLLGIWYWQNPASDSALEGNWLGDNADIYEQGNDRNFAGSEKLAGVEIPEETFYSVLPESAIALPEPNFFEENDPRPLNEGAKSGPHAELMAEAEKSRSTLAAADKLQSIESEDGAAVSVADTGQQPAAALIQPQTNQGVQETQAPNVPNASDEIVFTVAEESWLEVHDQAGKRLIYRTVPPGQRLTLEGKAPFSVFIGNAEGVAVQYRGDSVPFTAHGGSLFARFTVGAQ